MIDYLHISLKLNKNLNETFLPLMLLSKLKTIQRTILRDEDTPKQHANKYKIESPPFG